MKINTSDPVLKEVIRRVSSVVNLNSVYLFGSRAKGTFSENSDYDLLLISNFIKSEHGSIIDKCHDVLWGLKVSVDFVLMTQDEFESEVSVVNTIPELVQREGFEVYAA